MLVSLKWLSKYIDLPMSHEELALRLSLSGLNHEETTEIGGDIVIDLEVTSNRGDCLGHLGVAREIAVLYGLDVKTPEPKLAPGSTKVDTLLSVENRFVDACPRYTARVIQGVQVGPSPAWLVEALQSVFWKAKVDGTIEPYQSINNVVDATNFVMMECGQPLHAFDYAKVADQKIIVRPATKGETIEAIDHHSYELDASNCVIADANSPQAVAGVMGGAQSEVTDATTDLVIEAAIFTPLSVRRTARKLKLHSPSSFRFERKVDPVGVDWASRRVCELIVQIAGGTVADGIIDTAPTIPASPPVVLRSSQLERILGIKIDAEEVQRILTKLGCVAQAASDESGTYVPPSWRHDLTREADLIEEVARIHGYDKIPEDSPIPVAPSSKREFDTAMERVRHVLTSAAISEAMTPSIVTAKLDESISPWTDRSALQTETAMLKGARRLRRTLLPSLIEGRAKNWASASIAADLFEIAHIYLPSEPGQDGDDTLPSEQYSLGIVSGRDFFEVKGTLETLCLRMGIEDRLTVDPIARAGLAKGGAVALKIGDTMLGYLGIVDPKTLKAWKLPPPVVVAEISLPALLELSSLVPQQRAVSMFPSVQRDLNFVVAEAVRWAELENVVRDAVGDSLADVTYRETYRDPQKDGQGRKRVLLSVQLQRHDQTLSGEQADALIGKVVDECGKKLSAELLS
ncbi:Phenylalanine--tRNA ligase beta subunit [Rubripirellula lacrimiformis]|uniref:Phenylalanine--tRNA ligase beta subunit n=1 Tax=Rubripirellula lacrimiformis TaxID=1930273 RepID=A0A517NFS1_9BACT|nr:phenylalanine--tRNA ligase subunit beta [Rubripirellula lacrimiformis]QDT05989.1 Phenylalanine--tRNA ligase beta subunit [Rubripirellula lacrimiformis]